jgi:pyruvate,water dikinase
VDKERRLFILQSRPLRMPLTHTHMGTPLSGIPLLLRGGETACPGVATGPAVHMDADDDLDSFPNGAILVSRRSSPRFVRLMSKAGAIVTDVGGTTGHMASLTREFQIPALVNTGIATRSIPPGQIVTVDASSGFVYEGEVLRLIGNGEQCEKVNEPMGGIRLSPGFCLLEKVLEFVVPLNLTEPGSVDFTASKCSTLHDLARFVHEKSYQEMFMLGDNMGDLRGCAVYLDVFLPVDLYIIDLGGGLRGNAKKGKVKRSQIASAPFAALINGMLHEKIPRFGPRRIDMRGLLSVVMRHAMTNPEEGQSFSDPSYAIVSESYLNYTARVGYHFSVVDTYCSSVPNKNYISVLFRGGAADTVRRNRRARVIGEILKEYGFSVEVANDRVNARLSKAGRDETIRQVEMLGSLFQFFRQMDAAMADEQCASRFKEAFIKGDYGLEHLSSR